MSPWCQGMERGADVSALVPPAKPEAMERTAHQNGPAASGRCALAAASLEQSTLVHHTPHAQASRKTRATLVAAQVRGTSSL